MVYFVIQSGSEIPEDELELIYRLRYKVAVLNWGWNLPNCQDGRDKDQFDRPDTQYVLVYDDNDNLVACSRLNTTTEPHLLSEIFPHHCEFSGVPRGKDIWELSRFVVDKDQLTHYQQVQLYLQMCLAVTKFVVASGIRKVTWLSHKTRYTKSVVVWRTRPLGYPVHYEDDDQDYIAAIMDTDEAAIGRLRKFVKIDWSETLQDLPVRSARKAA